MVHKPHKECAQFVCPALAQRAERRRPESIMQAGRSTPKICNGFFGGGIVIAGFVVGVRKGPSIYDIHCMRARVGKTEASSRKTDDDVALFEQITSDM